MLNVMRRMRGTAALLACLMVYFSLQPAAVAGLVSTDELLAQNQAALDRDALLSALERRDVREALVMRGVDPILAKQRVAAMTNEEVASLQSEIDELPAGSGVLGTIVLILLILLFTDLVGWTDVYPRI